MNSLLFDGAFGTYYQYLTNGGIYPELANLNNEPLVFDIHKQYIKSGANAIKTNTFGANTAVYPDFDSVRDIIKAGFKIASNAAGSDCAVFADIGPIRSEPANAQAEYLDIVKVFLEQGAVNFLFETLSHADDIKSAVEYIKSSVKNSQVIVSFAVSQDGYTADGEFFLRLFDKAGDFNADYTGLNCVCGPAHMLELISRCDTSKYKIAAMPNAGYPSVIGGRLVYIDNPGYFAEKLNDIRNLGVSILGGCCGTTPEHIRAAAALFDIPAKISRSFIAPESPVFGKKEQNPEKKLIAVEIDPPIDTDASFLLDGSRKAKALGADYITLADSPLARTRADSFVLAAKVQREAGIKAIPHLSCRDKNQIAIKGQLLAGNIEGIQNVLAVTGDPITKEDRPGLNDVFGFNSYKLINFINNLNDDVFRLSPYTIYGALNINSVNFGAELKRAEEKIKNGASGLFTQPIYSNAHIENLRAARKSLSCRIFAGILPFASYKNALFLNNEVAGIEIPREIIESLNGQPEETVRDISVRFCENIIDLVYDLCDGFYFITPLKKISFVLDLISYVRSYSK